MSADVCEHGGLRRKCDACDLTAEVERVSAALDGAHWTIDQIRERIIAAMNGDLTALFEEIDRLCLTNQQLRQGRETDDRPPCAHQRQDDAS